MTTWDSYGNWDDIAKIADAENLKRRITGNSNVWRPNFFSSALHYIFEYAVDEAKYKFGIEPVAVDFGCGLGRNGPLLRRFFSTVVGVDLPEMIQRFKAESPLLAAQTYARLYDSLSDLADKEQFCTLYDSVVFQHLVDREHVFGLIDLISSQKSFRTFVSIHNSAIESLSLPHLSVLIEMGWHVWHSEVENLSFENVPHNVVVLRRA